MKQTIAAAIVYAFGLCLGGLLHAQTVLDSDFETPDVSGKLLGLDLFLGGAETFNLSSTATPTYLDPTLSGGPLGLGQSGWYVSAGSTTLPSVTLINQGLVGNLLGPITGSSGSQYLVLNGEAVSLGLLNPNSTLGGISQTISTTIGQTYQVSYLAGALSLGAISTTPTFSAGVTGVTTTGSGGGSLVNLSIGTFGTQSFTFTALSTQSTLNFTENTALGANVGGIAIDGVSITPVPEPSQYAAFFMGFATLLLLHRRLKSVLQSRKLQPCSVAPIHS